MLVKPLKFSSIFVTVAIIVSVLCPQVTAKEEMQIAQEQPSKRYRDFIVLYGNVREDVAYFFGISSPQYNRYLGSASWNECPTGFRLIGRSFNGHGFWLCARNDLASNTFFVGNVVQNVGHYYELSLQDGTHRLSNASWDYCLTGQLVGKVFESNGFWICMDSSK